MVDVTTDIAFATRPTKSGNAQGGQVVSLFSNNYRLRLGGDKEGVLYKYSINYEPDVPDNSKVGRKLTSLAKDTLKEKFECYFCWGNSLYSRIRITDDLAIPVEHDE